MYGFTGDHVGTDAIGMHPPLYLCQPLIRIALVNFINHQDPNYPNNSSNGSTALSSLSNITWPKYTLDTRQMLLFTDDITREYTTVNDTYRADGIAAIIELQSELGV